MEQGTKERIIKTTATAAAVGSVAVPAVNAEQAHAPAYHTRTGDQYHVMTEQQATAHHRHRRRSKYTGFVVSGRTSTFGWPAEGDGMTADGGSTRRPCIALRSSSTLGRLFELTEDHRHTIVKQCDTGPASWTGRDIDVTGMAVYKLHMNPFSYPTGIWGVARELRKPHLEAKLVKPSL